MWDSSNILCSAKMTKCPHSSREDSYTNYGGKLIQRLTQIDQSQSARSWWGFVALWQQHAPLGSPQGHWNVSGLRAIPVVQGRSCGEQGVSDMLCFNWKLCSNVIGSPRILLMSIPRSLHDWRYHRKEALSPRYPSPWSAAAYAKHSDPHAPFRNMLRIDVAY